MTGSGIALVVTALLSALASGLADNVTRKTPEGAAERVSKCGVGPATLRYEEDLQSHILKIASARSPTDEQLACIDKAAGWGVFVEFSPDVQRRFHAVREARARAKAVDDARTWLSGRGLLDRVPKYIEGASDAATFAQAIEQLCGPGAKGAFEFRYGRYALNPDWIRKMVMPSTSDAVDAFTCLTHVTTVAGFKVWMVGNEAVQH